MNRPTPIAITIDDNYIQHAVAMLQSLRFYNSKSFLIICISQSLSVKNQQLLLQLFQGSNLDLSFIRFDESQLEKMPIKTGDHVTATTFIRLWLPDLLPDFDTVLFLDCDIIICGDISGLLQADITNYPVAAASNPGIPQEKIDALGIPPGKDYFNAGVLKMNLGWFRKEKLTNKILAFIYEFPEKCEYWDQDALNAVLKGNFLKLSYKYNMQTLLYDKRLLTHPSFKEKLDEPVLIHFTGGGNNKPWFHFSKHPKKELYYKALQGTPFVNYIPPDTPSRIRLIKQIRFAPAALKRRFRKKQQYFD